MCSKFEAKFEPATVDRSKIRLDTFDEGNVVPYEIRKLFW